MLQKRAYREEVVSRAQGDASRFDQVYTAYELDKDVTRERIYIETIEEVLETLRRSSLMRMAIGSSVLAAKRAGQAERKLTGDKMKLTQYLF